MDGIAKRSSAERGGLFLDAAETSDVKNEALIEKDFWVCWILWKFLQSDHSIPVIFKGGTSLSKAYGIIKRFSEDVDLSFDRLALGFDDEKWRQASGKGRARLGQDLLAACNTHVRDRIRPQLADAIGAVLGEASASRWGLEHTYDPDKNEICLAFQYPVTEVTLDASGYVAPVVRLEFGARAEHWPEEERSIQPYAASAFPEEFTVGSFSVRTLHVGRTLWEKATILHKLAHGGADKIRPRMARHYSDLAQLVDSPAAATSLDNHDLLRSVAQHQGLYYASAWASYATAVPGTLRLVPPKEVIDLLLRDYESMEPLFFEDPIPFDQVVERLAKLESRVNGSQEKDLKQSLT